MKALLAQESLAPYRHLLERLVPDVMPYEACDVSRFDRNPYKGDYSSMGVTLKVTFKLSTSVPLFLQTVVAGYLNQKGYLLNLFQIHSLDKAHYTALYKDLLDRTVLCIHSVMAEEKHVGE